MTSTSGWGEVGIPFCCRRANLVTSMRISKSIIVGCDVSGHRVASVIPLSTLDEQLCAPVICNVTVVSKGFQFVAQSRCQVIIHSDTIFVQFSMHAPSCDKTAQVSASHQSSNDWLWSCLVFPLSLPKSLLYVVQGPCSSPVVLVESVNQGTDKVLQSISVCR